MIKKQTIPLIPFYFVRHGQTDWNLKNIRQGSIDIPLNETGIKEAQAAAPHFVGKGITRIVASPLVRAYKTAEIINEILQVPLITHEGLKEWSLGVLEGTPKKGSIITESGFTSGVYTPENGEHVDMFKQRIVEALHEVLDPNHVTLIVAHGGVYWAMTHMLGFEDRTSANAIPYFFEPIENLSSREWLVCQIEELSR